MTCKASQLTVSQGWRVIIGVDYSGYFITNQKLCRKREKRSPSYSLETMSTLREAAGQRAYHEEVQIRSRRIKNFPVRIRAIRASRKFSALISRDAPFAEVAQTDSSVARSKVDRKTRYQVKTEWRQERAGFKSKMKRVIVGLKTRQNGFREPIKLARIRKLFRNPSSILSASIHPLAVAKISLMAQQKTPIYFAFIFEILFKGALS